MHMDWPKGTTFLVTFHPKEFIKDFGIQHRPVDLRGTRVVLSIRYPGECTQNIKGGWWLRLPLIFEMPHLSTCFSLSSLETNVGIICPQWQGLATQQLAFTNTAVTSPRSCLCPTEHSLPSISLCLWGSWLLSNATFRVYLNAIHYHQMVTFTSFVIQKMKTQLPIPRRDIHIKDNGPKQLSSLVFPLWRRALIKD